LSSLTGYLIGFISFSFLIAKIFGKKDIRKVGIRNIGGSNVAKEVGFIFEFSRWKKCCNKFRYNVIFIF